MAIKRMEILNNIPLPKHLTNFMDAFAKVKWHVFTAQPIVIKDSFPEMAKNIDSGS